MSYYTCMVKYWYVNNAPSGCTVYRPLYTAVLLHAHCTALRCIARYGTAPHRTAPHLRCPAVHRDLRLHQQLPELTVRLLKTVRRCESQSLLLPYLLYGRAHMKVNIQGCLLTCTIRPPTVVLSVAEPHHWSKPLAGHAWVAQTQRHEGGRQRGGGRQRVMR